MARTSSSSAMTSMGRKLPGRVELLARHPVAHDPRELLAAVFLEKVTAALDGRVRLAGAARYVALERAIAAARDRVLVGECSQERLLPRAECLPGIAVVVGGRIVGSGRHEHREPP